MNNIFKNKKLSIVVLAAVLFTACSKKIDEAYTNPNATVRVPVETLLPGIIGNFVGNSSAQGSAYGTANDGLYIGRYVQFWATNVPLNQFDQMGGATGGSDLMGSIWAMHYYGMGSNLGKMIEWAQEEGKNDFVAVGNAIRAWSWLTLTDTYGEAILKQAFDPSRLVFDYDSQEEIYAEVRRLCHTAIAQLSTATSSPQLAQGDAYFYGGDLNKWKKFTYSVLARSFHHLTNKATYNADSVLVYSNQGITSYTDDATAKFLATGLSGEFNFYSVFRANAGALRQSRFISNLLTGLNPTFTGVNDPRVAYLIRENTNGTYKGIRPNRGTDGLVLNDQPQNFWGNAFVSTTGANTAARYIFRNAAPFPIVTAAEIHFMRAEAYLIKGAAFATQARQSYIDGINASFDMLQNTTEFHSSVPTARQITAAARAAFLANPAVVPAAAALTKSHIMLQKYIAMYGHGLVETWTDMRRYHYVDIDPVTGKKVYDDFTPPSGSDLFVDNANELVYRARPRYNSEFLYNIAALDAVGGRRLNYHTFQPWFCKP
jgi:hypothetical protein